MGNLLRSGIVGPQCARTPGFLQLQNRRRMWSQSESPMAGLGAGMLQAGIEFAQPEGHVLLINTSELGDYFVNLMGPKGTPALAMRLFPQFAG